MTDRKARETKANADLAEWDLKILERTSAKLFIGRLFMQGVLKGQGRDTVSALNTSSNSLLQEHTHLTSGPMLSERSRTKLRQETLFHCLRTGAAYGQGSALSLKHLCSQHLRHPAVPPRQ